MSPASSVRKTVSPARAVSQPEMPASIRSGRACVPMPPSVASSVRFTPLTTTVAALAAALVIFPAVFTVASPLALTCLIARSDSEPMNAAPAAVTSSVPEAVRSTSSRWATSIAFGFAPVASGSRITGVTVTVRVSSIASPFRSRVNTPPATLAIL